MVSERDPHTQGHDERPSGMLGERLPILTFDWYKGMVDESTGRLLYLYDPESDITIGDGEPIRDIAAIWDVEVDQCVSGRDDLRPLILRSLDYFSRLIDERDEYAIVAVRGGAIFDRPQRFPGARPLSVGVSRQNSAAGAAHRRHPPPAKEGRLLQDLLQCRAG